MDYWIQKRFMNYYLNPELERTGMLEQELAYWRREYDKVDKFIEHMVRLDRGYSGNILQIVHSIPESMLGYAEAHKEEWFEWLSKAIATKLINKMCSYKG